MECQWGQEVLESRLVDDAPTKADAGSPPPRPSARRLHSRRSGERKGLQGPGPPRPLDLGRRHRLPGVVHDLRHAQSQRMVPRQHRLWERRRPTPEAE